ncbi:alpha/beta hydrolase [Ottowia sp. SB7-C50]|uniref:alpha/beta hydrolase n=1 Tax=Ottowia sp. SB7-C50 TaxID=3081231 RepID=UPI0029542960|nr:alpha/beta hydrolase [Ottowia sp. SB7-C50]WOP15562.1 alpha/beta hydrolase [Ottowia sp. SB7-C50]
MTRILRFAAFTLAPLALAALVAGCAAPTPAPKAAAAPVGEIKGTAWAHTPQSLAASVQNAAVVLPAQATGGTVYSGKWSAIPASTKGPVPVVLFLHGSSGLGLKAIGDWQQWLAAQGIASVAPDSFALPDHVTYKSPIDKASYERIHALRASEIAPALAAIQAAPWADRTRLVLAGTSEGAVPVARYTGKEFAARLLFAWSCEPNYFVTEPRNAFEPDKPVLNVISSVDPFFSPSNTWLGNAQAKGSCADALKDHKNAVIALIPGAPHTLLTLPPVQAVTGGFLRSVLAR